MTTLGESKKKGAFREIAEERLTLLFYSMPLEILPVVIHNTCMLGGAVRTGLVATNKKEGCGA